MGEIGLTIILEKTFQCHLHGVWCDYSIVRNNLKPIHMVGKEPMALNRRKEVLEFKKMSKLFCLVLKTSTNRAGVAKLYAKPRFSKQIKISFDVLTVSFNFC